MASIDSVFKTHVKRQCTRIELNSKDNAGSPLSPWDIDKWADKQCIVLLGEPGSGKSAEFRHQIDLTRADGQVVFETNWQEWIPAIGLQSSFVSEGSIQDVLGAGKNVVWYIDALDEGRIVAKEAFGYVKEAVRKIRDLGLLPRLKLRISCRSRDWRELDYAQLVSLLQVKDNNSDSLVALQLEPLSQLGIHTLAMERLGSEAAANRFIDAMERRHTEALAGSPLLLDMMLRIYAAGEESLGTDRTGLYEHAVKLLSVDKNLARQGTTKTLPKDRVEYAQKIASRAVFQARDTIYLPEDDIEVSNGLNVEPFTDNKILCLETLDTGLFTRQANGGFRFRHRSFAEFLAAQELMERLEAGTPFGYVLPLFPAVEGYLPSPLRETAAWLAGMDGRFRTWLCERDPLTAAHGDTIRYSVDERKNLLASLAAIFEGRSWQNDFQRFGDLASSVPEESIRELLRREKSLAVRNMAMKAISAAKRAELFDDLLAIALDTTDLMDVRISAVDTLMQEAAEKYSPVLRSLVIGENPNDDAQEIAGIVLNAAYPAYVSLDVALQSLVYGKTEQLNGMFRLFWARYFLRRTTLDRASRRSILIALDVFLNDKREWDPVDCYVSVFVDVLNAEIASGPEDIPGVGRWLETVVEASNNMRVQPGQIGELSKQISSAYAFKREYLSWFYGVHVPKPNMLATFNLPFSECYVGPADGDVWIELARQFSEDPSRGKALFGQVIRFAQEYPSSELLHRIEELAGINLSYANLWGELKQWNLEDAGVKMLRANIRRRFHRPLPRQSIEEIAAENIEAFREGNPPALLWALQASGNDLLGDLDVSATSRALGTGAANAISQGLLQCWTQLNDTTECWPIKSEISGRLVLLNMACSLGLPDLDKNTSLSAVQVDFLIWRCLYIGAYDELGIFLWEHHREAFWHRLEATLTAESQFANGTVSLAWEKIAHIPHLPKTLVDAITQLLLRLGLPPGARVRKLGLSIALKSLDPEMVDLLHKEVNSDWSPAGVLEQDFDEPKIATLAAFWLCNPADAIETIRDIAFQGDKRRVRAAAFYQAVKEIVGQSRGSFRDWPTSVSLEAYAALLPLLFFEGETPRETTRSGILSPDDIFSRSRESLIEYLSRATSSEAVTWFGGWKNNPRFGELQEWMGVIYRTLVQKSVDDAWQPLTEEQSEGFFLQGKFLVKNTRDLAQLVGETIDQDVRPTFRSDHGLTTQLWEGTKGSGTRKRKAEKDLQDILYNQVMLSLKRRPVVGAREAEQLDAKKPDAVISAVVSDDIKVCVPIEIKWSDHLELWNAPESQVLKKYLQDPRNTHGIYLVAWAGANNVTAWPSHKQATDPDELVTQLQDEVDRVLKGTGKTICVHVVDATL